MVNIVGVLAQQVIGFGFISQAYRYKSNLDYRHIGTIIQSVNYKRIGAISLLIVCSSTVPAQGQFRKQISTKSC